MIDDRRFHARLADLLRQGEKIEAVISGMYGTLPGGGYPTVGVGAVSASDAFLVALTTERLLAVPYRLRKTESRATLEADRPSSRVSVTRKVWLIGYWASFVFGTKELRLLVFRQSRRQLERMVEAVGEIES